jgi:hypothetical protein
VQGDFAHRGDAHPFPYSRPFHTDGRSTSVRVADCRTHAAHGVVVDVPNMRGEHGLRDRVETVAVHDRFLIKPDRSVVNTDFCCEAARRCRDFCNRHEHSDIEHLRAREDQDGTAFTSYVCQPDLAAIHSAPHASAAVQNVSTDSGVSA